MVKTSTGKLIRKIVKKWKWEKKWKGKGKVGKEAKERGGDSGRKRKSNGKLI